jgi:hypothetical protein
MNATITLTLQTNNVFVNNAVIELVATDNNTSSTLYNNTLYPQNNNFLSPETINVTSNNSFNSLEATVYFRHNNNNIYICSSTYTNS